MMAVGDIEAGSSAKASVRPRLGHTPESVPDAVAIKIIRAVHPGPPRRTTRPFVSAAKRQKDQPGLRPDRQDVVRCGPRPYRGGPFRAGDQAALIFVDRTAGNEPGLRLFAEREAIDMTAGSGSTA